MEEAIADAAAVRKKSPSASSFAAAHHPRRTVTISQQSDEAPFADDNDPFNFIGALEPAIPPFPEGALALDLTESASESASGRGAEDSSKVLGRFLGKVTGNVN
jgi:hypothetical protein